MREIGYLGHIVSDKGVSPNPQKIEAIKLWPVPQDVAETKGFLGLGGYYRHFIKNFARIAAPLFKLTSGYQKGKKKDRKKIKPPPFIWTSECQEAFDLLKLALTSAPVLLFADSSKPFVLDADGSLVGLGAILSQNGQVVAYASRGLSKHERNSSVMELECLAVVWAIKHFWIYLLGSLFPFTIRTDHSALTSILKLKEPPNNRIARWVLRLQEYTFVILHRPGTSHGNADSLSRRPHSS